MRAIDIMSDEIVCIDVKESVFDAAELLLGARISAAPVTNDKGELVDDLAGPDQQQPGRQQRNDQDSRGRHGSESARQRAEARLHVLDRRLQLRQHFKRTVEGRRPGSDERKQSPKRDLGPLRLKW